MLYNGISKGQPLLDGFSVVVFVLCGLIIRTYR